MFSNKFMCNRFEKENINWTMKWIVGSVIVNEMLHHCSV